MSNIFNLPRQAGSRITTIDGKRCTAVPRSDIPKASSAPPTTSAAPARATAAPAPQPQQPTTQAPVVAPTTSAAAVAPPPPAVVVPEPSTTPVVVPPTVVSSVEIVPTQATTSAPSFLSPGPIPEFISQNTRESAVPALEALESSIDTATGESQSQIESLPTSAPTSVNRDSADAGRNTIPPEPSTMVVDIVPSTTRTQIPESTSLPPIITATSRKSDVGPIVGGVVGTIVLIAIIAVIFFFCRRRRRGESIISPLSTGTREKFYEIDNGSVGPTRRTHRWKQEFAFRSEGWKSTWAGVTASLKSKVSGDRSDTPSVNMNRGNSQFFHTSVATHSRNNSSAMSGLASTRSGESSARDRFEDWWERFTDRWRFPNREDELVGPYDNPRSMYEKQASANAASTIAQLAAFDEREKDILGHSRNSSLTAVLVPTLPPLDPHLDPFADPHNPFADPAVNTQSQSQHWLPPKALGASLSNPFADPITAPAPSVPKPQNYVAAVRRSRTLSSAAPPGSQPNASRLSTIRSSGITSRYPSTIAPSSVGDSDRDTFMSFVNGTRKGKGRSDPFDLERPELRLPVQDRSGPPLSHQSQNHSKRAEKRTGPAQANDSSFNTNSLRMTNSQQRDTYSSQYSSGVDSLGDWGDPGPDFENRSIDSSLRGNASTRDGRSSEYDRDAIDIDIMGLSGGNGNGLGTGLGSGVYLNHNITGSLAEFLAPLNEKADRDRMELERRRNVDNVSPISIAEPRPPFDGKMSLLQADLARRRQIDNVSPVSALSTKSVGKAM